METEGLLPCL